MNAGYASGYVKVYPSLPLTHLRLLFERSLDRREHLRFLCDASDGRKSHMTERGTEEISP